MSWHALFRGGSRCRRWLWKIVEVQNRIGQHVELAEILPAITGICSEQQHSSLPDGYVDDSRTSARLSDALHESAQNGFVGPWKLCQHPLFPVFLRKAQQRTIGITNRHDLLRVAVEDGMHGLQYLRLDNRAGRVELRRRPRGV